MKKHFASLHSRTYCHATEDLDRVNKAMQTVLGDNEMSVSRTEGVHGNPILVIESAIADVDDISRFFHKLSEEDLENIATSAESRVDDSCNLFLRLDKQAAYLGEARIGQTEDVITVRLRVNAFPARREVACQVVREFIFDELSRRRQQPSEDNTLKIRFIIISANVCQQ